MTHSARKHVLRSSWIAVLFVGLICANSTPVLAATITIGDNDGYGFGLLDNGTVAMFPGPDLGGSNYDGRSAGEQSASNGAQFTDAYSAFFPGAGPNAETTARFIFDLPIGVDLLPGAFLTIDLADFQSRQFGLIASSYFDGALPTAPGMFDIFTPSAPNPAVFDAFGLTSVNTFVLSPDVISKANAERQLVLTLDRGSSQDYVAFDYLSLTTEPVPEPATLTLLGTGAALLAARRMRNRRKKPTA